jgi:hypothetical protein
MSVRGDRVAALAVSVALASLLAGAAGPTVAGRSIAGLAAPRAIPPNDDFADAAPVGPLPATKHVNTTDATTEATEPISVCNGSEFTVWYRITLPSTRVVSVDTLGSVINTGVSVWKGPALDLLDPVACSYGSERLNGEELAGRTAFRAKAGVHYYIQVDAQRDSVTHTTHGGPITLHVKTVIPPANDAFGQAQVVPTNFHTMVSNAKATMQNGEPATGACDQMRATLWYRLTPAHDTVLRADTFGSQPDTMLAVFTGSSLANIKYRQCDDDTSFDHQAVHKSSVTWHATAGTTYFIQLGGYDNETGNIDFTIQPVTPPANDARGAATTIASLPFAVTQSDRNATQQQAESVAGCGTTGDFLHSVWYRYTATSGAMLHVTVGGDDGTSALVAIFTGSSFTTDTEIGCAYVASTDYTPVSGTTYYFLLTGKFGRTGPLQLDIVFAS